MAEPGNRIAALRGDRRFECAMRPFALEPVAAGATTEADGGVVLITGGFGGIGLTLARDLAARGAKLALLARHPLPERADWADYLKRHAPQDRIATRIRAVQSLEAAGAEVMVVAADVCDRIAVMYCGEIVETAPVDDLFATPAHPYTLGLLSAMPHGSSGTPPLPVIPGAVPTPGHWPEGCRFAPRCAHADAACARPVPLTGDARMVRCVHANALSLEAAQ